MRQKKRKKKLKKKKNKKILRKKSSKQATPSHRRRSHSLSWTKPLTRLTKRNIITISTIIAREIRMITECNDLDHFVRKRE